MDIFLRNLAEMNPFSAFLRGLAGLGTSFATLTVKYSDLLDQYNSFVSFVASIIALISAIFGALYLRQAWKNGQLENQLKQREWDSGQKDGPGTERTP